MLSKRRLSKCLFVVFITVLLSSCGGTIATSTPTQMPVETETQDLSPKDGHWESVGAQNHTVSIDIADGKVTYFKILVSGDCTVEFAGSIYINPDNFFKMGEVDSKNQPINNSITGTFTSPTTVTGLITNPFGCGNNYYGSTNEDFPVWTAEWQNP